MKKIIPAVLAALLLIPAFCYAEEDEEVPMISFTQTGESFDLYDAHYASSSKTILSNFYGWGENPKKNYPQIDVTFWAASPNPNIRYDYACTTDLSYAKKANDAAMVRRTMVDGSDLLVWRDQTDPQYSWFHIIRCGVWKDGKTKVRMEFKYLAKKDAFEKTQNASKFSAWVSEIVAAPWPLQWAPPED